MRRLPFGSLLGTGLAVLLARRRGLVRHEMGSSEDDAAADAVADATAMRVDEPTAATPDEPAPGAASVDEMDAAVLDEPEPAASKLRAPSQTRKRTNAPRQPKS